MKLILPTELANAIQPRLPNDVDTVWVDPNGNLDGDASNASVYFNGFRLKQTTLHRVLAAAPMLRWQHSPSAGAIASSPQLSWNATLFLPTVQGFTLFQS